MMKVETVTVINRPLAQVFEFMTTPENDLQWQSGLLERERISEGPIGVGSTVRSETQFLGRRIESTFEVTEYEQDARFGGKIVSGPFPLEILLTFESVEGGTAVAQTLEADAGGFFKLAQSLVKRQAQKQLESDLATVKGLLENGA